MTAPVHATIVGGRYALFDAIASGGMATISYGRLVGTGGFLRTVAIKRLHASYAREPEFVAMLLDEARLVSRIRHANVVSILDVVAEEGELVLVMDYVAGESLASLFKLSRERGIAVPVPVLAQVVCGALEGLHAAHEARDEAGNPLNMVHRDVSPHNIMVDVDGTARVLDFGVAKAANRLQQTRDGQVKGKPSYMAPEQLLSEQIDRRVDVYAMSAVLWEGVVGRRMFEHGNIAEVMSKVLNGNIDPPSALTSGVPGALEEVILKGLSTDAANRYGTALDLAAAIEAAVRPASRRETADWLRQLAGAQLDAKAARVCEIESIPVATLREWASRENARPSDTLGTDVVAVDEEPPKRSVAPARRYVAVAFAFAAALGMAVVFVVLGSTATVAPVRAEGSGPPSPSVAVETPSPSPGRSASTPVPAAAVSAVPRADGHDPAPSPSPSSDLSTTPPSTKIRAAAPRPKPAAAPPTAPKPSQPDCATTPYVVDGAGIKRVRPECL